VSLFLRDEEMSGEINLVVVPLNTVAVSVPAMATEFAEACREIES
jgi:hypothetical protein